MNVVGCMCDSSLNGCAFDHCGLAYSQSMLEIEAQAAKDAAALKGNQKGAGSQHGAGEGGQAPKCVPFCLTESC